MVVYKALYLVPHFGANSEELQQQQQPPPKLGHDCDLFYLTCILSTLAFRVLKKPHLSFKRYPILLQTFPKQIHQGQFSKKKRWVEPYFHQLPPCGSQWNVGHWRLVVGTWWRWNSAKVLYCTFCPWQNFPIANSQGLNFQQDYHWDLGPHGFLNHGPYLGKT